MSAAASHLTDITKLQGVVNNVAGLDALQKALNAGISEAINAGNKPLGVMGGDISTTTIIIVVVVLVILYFLFGRSSSNTGAGGPQIIIANK